jgi:Na+/melibiose symporter-like transporter
MAGVVMGVLTYRYLLFADAAHADPRFNPAGYVRFALASGIVMLASILISARGTHRYIAYFRAPEQRRITLGETLREMASSLSHGQFVILVIAAIFGTVSNGLNAQLHIYFNTYFWGLSTAQISIFPLTGLGAAFIAPFFAPLVSHYLGKKNAALLFYFTCVAVMVSPYLLRFAGFFPANGTNLLVGLLFVERSVVAILGISCLILFSSMMADVVEDSAIRTGRRSEGLFFSSMSFIAKALSGAGAFLAGQLLALADFPERANPATLNPAIPNDLALFYIPTLLLFYGIGIVALSRYRISKEQHEDNVRRLREGVDTASAPVFDDLPAVEIAAREAAVDVGVPAVPRPAE